MIYGCDECGCIRKDVDESICGCECHKEYNQKSRVRKE